MVINFALITIDSLRYDVTQIANSPNFEKLFAEHQRIGNGWEKVCAHGTYTLPAHVSMFTGGKFPSSFKADPPFKHSHGLFRYGNNTRNAEFSLQETDTSVPGSFAAQGYRTIGVGGVDWFNSSFYSSRDLWSMYFKEFYYADEFSPVIPNSFERQIQLLKTLDMKSLVFLFLNIASTHRPYRLKAEPDEKGNYPSYYIKSQVDAFEYVDSHILEVIDVIPRPANVFICSDHGECFTEVDGVSGHGFYHPSVMEVPACYLNLR